MAEHMRAPTRTFEAAAVIAKGLRVKVTSAGLVDIAGAADNDIGTAATYAHAIGDEITVNMASLEGTDVYVASATIAIGDEVYGSAAGKISTTDTGVPIGIALSGGASGASIEVLRRQVYQTVA